MKVCMKNTDREQFAYLLATTMNDKEAISFYRQVVNTYDESFIRKILNRVMSIPEHKIKKSRGALFTHLITHTHDSSSRA